MMMINGACTQRRRGAETAEKICVIRNNILFRIKNNSVLLCFSGKPILLQVGLSTNPQVTFPV